MSNRLLSVELPIADADANARPKSGTGSLRQALPQQVAQPEMLFACLDRFGLVVLDCQGQVTLWNSGAECLTGFPHSEIVGRPISRLYTIQDVAAGAPDFDLKQARCKQKIRCDGWRLQKNGAAVWLGFEISRLLDQNNQLSGYSVLMVEPINTPGHVAV